MDITEKLRQWGDVHAKARAAESAAAGRGSDGRELHQQARRLREEADRLHRAVYGELGNRRPH
jgi:hypothetical protein